jgi:hypothetical protein
MHLGGCGPGAAQGLARSFRWFNPVRQSPPARGLVDGKVQSPGNYPIPPGLHAPFATEAAICVARPPGRVVGSGGACFQWDAHFILAEKVKVIRSNAELSTMIALGHGPH